MLTKKNRAALSSVWTSILLAIFTGCQPSGPKSLLLGDKYVRQGEYPKALKYLARAAMFMPERPQVWNLEGLAYHGMQQPARAVEAYQRALRIDRNFAPARFNLGVLLLEEERPADAANELNVYVALQPNDDQGWARLGDALVRMRKTDEAERALTQALKLNSKNADAHNSMGMVHIQHKRPREAMQAFNTALQYRPGFGSALLNQAVTAQQYFGNDQIALERYRAYLTTKPDAKSAAKVQLAIRQIEGASAPAPPPVALSDLTTNTGIGALLRSNLAARTPNIVPEPNVASQAPKTNAPPAEIAATKSNPPPQTVTAKTNPPPQMVATPEIANANARATATNPPVAVDAAKTNAAKTNAAKTNAVAQLPEETTEAPVPAEVVKVTSEPELPAAKDIESSASTNQTARAADDRPLLAPRKKEEEKRGLLSRLKQANPAHWFEHDEPKTVPIPATTQRTAPPITPESNEAPAHLAPAIAPPVFARYQYRTNASPAKGNRAQAQKLFLQAGSAYQQRQTGHAIALYRQALNADPTYFEAAYNLGVLAYQDKDLPLALAADEQAVALKPGSTDAHYNFALALREAHYPVDAANELRELLNEAPKEARAHLALGNLYSQQLDELALARTHYQHFLDLAPNHPDAGAVRQWLIVHP
jgi:tetratricopeptide (TPR) repeat protein